MVKQREHIKKVHKTVSLTNTSSLHPLIALKNDIYMHTQQFTSSFKSCNLCVSRHLFLLSLNLRIHKPPRIYPIFWPEKDCILTEDNLINVQERRDGQALACICNTSTDGESHDLCKKSVWYLRMCTYVCTRGQWVSGTMDNKTVNSLFHRLPFQHRGLVSSQDHSLFMCVRCREQPYVAGREHQ